MKKKFNRKRPSIDRKSTGFKPNRAYVENAMDFYLANGGTITKIVLTEKDFKNFIATNENPSAVDDWLNGQ